MRISELAEVTGVPVHTLKFYLREGVLMSGRPTSRTRAEYDETHVDRVRLVRALVEHGGVGLQAVRTIVDTLAAPPPSQHELLGVAHRALPGGDTSQPPTEEVLALVEHLGWPVCDSPALRALGASIEAARAAGVPLETEALYRYAAAAHDTAEVDVDMVAEATTQTDALRRLVIGTVLLDPVLGALRRVAAEAVSAGRW